MQTITPEAARAIAAEVVSELHGARIDPAQHAADHRWVQEKRKAQAEWATLRRKIVTSSAIWAIPLLLGFLAVASWEKLLRLLTGAGQ